MSIPRELTQATRSKAVTAVPRDVDERTVFPRARIEAFACLQTQTDMPTLNVTPPLVDPGKKSILTEDFSRLSISLQSYSLGSGAEVARFA